MANVNINIRINAKQIAFPYGSKSEFTLLSWCNKFKPESITLKEFYFNIANIIE
jgi:hypothetical protein